MIWFLSAISCVAVLQSKAFKSIEFMYYYLSMSYLHHGGFICKSFMQFHIINKLQANGYTRYQLF